MQDALTRLRPELNSMYEYFLSVNRDPDADDILDVFCRIVIPLYEMSIAPADEILCGLFGEALNLCGRAFIGRHGRFSHLENELFRIIHHHDELLAVHKGFMTSVFNALYNIHVKDESAIHRWSDAMLSGWHIMDTDSFRKLGLVHAWMCGLARYREEALSIAGTFSDDLLDRVFGAAGLPGRTVLLSMKNDPWFNPAVAGSSPVFVYTDGHRALGGHFMDIPVVYARDGILYADDQQSVFRIYADRFGVDPVHEPDTVPGTTDRNLADELKFAGGKFITGDIVFNLPSFCSGEVKSCTAAGNTVAWTMKNSYKIYIAGLKADHGC